ncbi:hypothetical protein BDZ45DRAFT_791064 [Acephala macrosclerotiorum]|nr:hypothetical protein BDZ45DRAFT_791064 [Acephala macrosclerotiorum]
MSCRRVDFDPDGDLLLRLTYSPDDPDEDTGQLSASLADPALQSDGDGHKGDKALAKNEVRMLVSSKHLRLASPVFHAMFHPQHFQEGKLLGEKSETEPVEVEFPDDEPKTFELSMSIIHGLARRVPWEISFDTLTNLTILADKYQMVEVITPYVQIWLTKRQTNPMRAKNFTKKTLLPWLCIAWIFNLPDTFEITTTSLVRESECRPDVEGLPVPDHVLDAIESQRLQGISTLFDAITRAYNTENEELTPEKMSGAQLLLTNALRKQALWPLPQAPYAGHSIWSIANSFRKLKIVAHEHDELSQLLHGVDPWQARVVQRFLYDAADSVWRNVTGLDLESVRNGLQKAQRGYRCE